MTLIRGTKNFILQLSIIIVNYNVKYFLEQCLCSVIKACSNIKAEIFVIDNNSTDGSNNFFAGRFPQVKFIWKNENAGFAKANNEALKMATGEKILFLNPDTIVPEDCFEKCLEFFNRQKDCGALGVKMIDGSGVYLPESKRGFPSVFTSFCKMTGLTALFPGSKLFARYYLGHLPNDKTNKVDVLSGAFIMADKKVLDKTGGFDEDYFMYAEDIDLSYRIQKLQYKNFYFAETAIIHFKGESTKKTDLDYVRVFYGAMALFVKKHYGGSSSNFYALLIQAAIAAKATLAALGRAFKKTGAANDGRGLSKRNCLIVADEQNSRGMAVALTASGKRTVAATAESINSLKQLLQQHNANEILFCANGLSYKSIIETMQQNFAGINFLFHAAGSSSMVGSGDKNSNGEAAVIEPVV